MSEVAVVETTVVEDEDGTRASFDLVPIIDSVPGLDTFEGKKRAFNAVNGAISLNDFEGKSIKVVGILQTKGYRVSLETGDNIPCCDSVLIGADGVGYFSKSDGIARSAQAIIRMFGNCSAWDNGVIEVKVEERALKNGRNLKLLQLVS